MPTPDQIAELNKARVENFHELARARLGVIASLSLLGMRSLFLLNGGAIVSLFTLLGHGQDLGVPATHLWGAFIAFVGGLVLVLVAILFGFLSQNEFMRDEFQAAERTYFEAATATSRPDLTRSSGKGMAYWFVAIALVVLSLLAFVIGAALALVAVQHLPASAPHRP